jgi:hypothetical protein
MHGVLLEGLQSHLKQQANDDTTGSKVHESVTHDRPTSQSDPTPSQNGTSSRITGHPKPNVLLIGNSLLHDIHPRALSSLCNIRKAQAGTATQATQLVKESTATDVDCVCVQLITNEAKDTSHPKSTVQTCTQQMAELLESVETKWPSSKIVVSLAPPRGDSDECAEIQTLINGNLVMEYTNNSKICVIRNDDFGHNGWPDQSLYHDHVHLNTYGTGLLASKLKRAIHTSLSLKPTKYHK